MQCKKLLAVSFLALQLAIIQPSYCADEETATTGATTTLQGNVVQVEVTLNNLRDARLSVSRVRKAAANLYDEVSRQQMTMTFNPNVVGNTVIMMPKPSYTGPLLPPRQKWVAEFMAEIRPIMKLFKEDVDLAIESNRRTDVREQTKKSLDPIREEAFAQVKKSFEVYEELEKLTTGTTYNNSAIANATTELDTNVKALDKTLKRGISILQKEAKAAKKAARA